MGFLWIAGPLAFLVATPVVVLLAGRARLRQTATETPLSSAGVLFLHTRPCLQLIWRVPPQACPSPAFG